MKVSVLIPYYNDERFLRQAVESVLTQTFADFELVLVNHASTDGSRAIARSFDDPRIVHVDMPVNHGAGGGLVVAEFLKVARGEYVKFFCADDVMLPDGLATLVGYMESHPDIGFAFGDVRYVDDKACPLGTSWFPDRGRRREAVSEIACLRLLAEPCSFLPWSGGIVRRLAMDGVELDVTAIMTFDISLWSSLLMRGERIGFVDDAVADYRIHPGQVSAIGNRTGLRQCVAYEFQSYFSAFMGCGPELAKAVFQDDPCVQMAMTDEESRLAVAWHYLKQRPSNSYWAYLHIRACLQNPVSRLWAEERLGITVARFRSLVKGNDVRGSRRSRWVAFRDRWLRKRRQGNDELGKYSL